MTDADRFHIPPRDGCARCGEPEKEHHYNGACYGKCGEYVAGRAVVATHVVDLKPLVDWWRDELSAARTAAADAKCHAAGHREEVVRLEARLAELSKPRADIDYKTMLEKRNDEWNHVGRLGFRLRGADVTDCVCYLSLGLTPEKQRETFWNAVRRVQGEGVVQRWEQYDDGFAVNTVPNRDTN